MSPHRPLLVGALVHAVLAVGCLVALSRPAELLLGVHPALKPFKFALSIAVLLGSMAVLLPRMEAAVLVREGLAWLLLGTMVVEMAVIVAQALRGTTSHFNLRTPLDATLWHTMMGAIVLATMGLFAIAVLTTWRPLEGMTEVMQFAWRAGVWLSLLGAVSGFRMGGQLSHSVGGPDGAPGWWLVNWSRAFGDLRVSHFISLHALQALPVVAWLVAGVSSPLLQWGAVAGAAAVTALLAVGTLVQALLGRPVW